VLLAGELEPFHLRVPEVERMAAQVPSQRRSPRTVQGIVVIIEPHGIVKEGEQEYERRVGAGYLRKEGEFGRGDTLPVAFTVYGRIRDYILDAR
jgi:hypothetical protein